MVSRIIFSNDPYPTSTKKIGVHIESGAVICVGAVLREVRVGSGSVVGLGSNVTKDVPPRSVVYGNPEKSQISFVKVSGNEDNW